MDEPLPKWVSALIAIPFLTLAVWLIVVLRRRGERELAERKDEAFRAAMTALYGPLDERQLELLRRGALPWYELPAARGGAAPPAGQPKPPAAAPPATPPGGEPKSGPDRSE